MKTATYNQMALHMDCIWRIAEIVLIDISLRKEETKTAEGEEVES